MNKLLIDRYSEIENIVIEQDTELHFDYYNCEKKINIIVEKDICLNVVDISNKTNNSVDIVLNENSSLIYNKACTDIGDNIVVNLNGFNSNVDIHSSIVNKNNSKLNFLIRHNNINTLSSLSNHGVNASDDNLKIIVDVIVNQNAINSRTSQNNKIINLCNGVSNILPNLIVDNNEVDASHSAYISDFDKESIFYMKTRGIKEDDINKMLIDGFLIGNLTIDDKNKINEILKI